VSLCGIQHDAAKEPTFERMDPDVVVRDAFRVA
jgi:hypothetical protein